MNLCNTGEILLFAGVEPIEVTRREAGHWAHADKSDDPGNDLDLFQVGALIA